MTLTHLIRDLGLAGLTLQGLLSFALFAKGSWRRFPFFSAYVGLSFVVGVVGYSLQKSPNAYFYAYWLGEALGIALGLLIVYEIFRHLFTVHGALLRLATVTFKIAFGVLLIAGLIVFFQSPSHTSSLAKAILAVEQATRIIEVGLLMILFICSAAFGLHWKQAEFGIALGLGFFATLELMAVTLHHLVGLHGAELLNVMRIAALVCSLFIWLGYLLAPERAAASVEMPKQAQLEQWNQAVMELINR
ncbi:MAG: hypothetical protein WA672_15865 [Candidatus Angelobacter sp.]